jgi:flavin reductase (DIM6/NTAB) family NADH-FMN oxidoreductase RutF
MSQSEPLVNATDYPLYVVTAAADGQRSGCMAGFVTQSSLQPIRFLICISRVNHTFAVADKSEGLALHLLGADQYDLASLFGEQSGDEIDKFARVQWSTGPDGVPVLAECAAWVAGRVIDRMRAGDHEAFLISVTDGAAGTHQGRFMSSVAESFKPGHPG